MKNFESKLDDLVNKILTEEIEKKSKKMSEQAEEDWMEIEVDEELHGGQHKLDVADPKGKLTSADFKKLRNKGKKEIEEFYLDMDSEYDFDDKDISKGDNEEYNWSISKSTSDKMNSVEDLDDFDYDTSDIEEQETEEGNAFSGALADAKKQGKSSFEVGGKKYDVKESNNSKEGKRKIRLTEDELIDMIYDIVKEQKLDKGNIQVKSPEGLNKTKDVLILNKKENENATKETSKKMSDYLSKGSKGKYEPSAESFPKGNGEIAKMNKKAYSASDAVEEYIENFAYPGLENLSYDEIKPNEEWVTDNLEGSSRTGNNPEWANAVKTDLGKKMNEKRKRNLYQKEKERSYKRVSQPIDEAGEGEGEKSLDKMFTKLESKEDKSSKLMNEEISKMKNIITYNRKTQ